MELKYTIAHNISSLRKSCGMTQLQLAEKLNYSDKAVSKWESGASLPDITVLKQIADFFGVTVDSLISEGIVIEEKKPDNKRVHLVISLLSVMLVFLIATVVYVPLELVQVSSYKWLPFVWAIPVSMVVGLIFNTIWGNRRMNYLIISVMMWTLLLAFYLTFIVYNPFHIFVLGVPGQVIICLWSAMNKKREKY